MPESRKISFAWNLRLFAGDDIPYLHAVHFRIAENFDYGGVPMDLDFRIRLHAFRHDFGGAERIAAVDQMHFTGKMSQERGFLHGAVAAAYDNNGNIAVECAVAGRAGGHAFVQELFFGGKSEPAGRGARCNDQRAAFRDFAVSEHQFVRAALHQLDTLHGFIDNLRAEFFRLLLELEHQFISIDRIGKTGKVFNVRGLGQQPAGKRPGKNHRIQICPRSIDCSGQPGGAASDNDHIFFHQDPPLCLVNR